MPLSRARVERSKRRQLLNPRLVSLIAVQQCGGCDLEGGSVELYGGRRQSVKVSRQLAYAASLLCEVGGARGGIEQGGRTSKHPCSEASMKSGEALALSISATVRNWLDLVIL